MQVYKNILVDVKKQYDMCIDSLEKKQLNRYQLNIEMQKANVYSVTISNLEKRRDELNKT